MLDMVKEKNTYEEVKKGKTFLCLYLIITKDKETKNKMYLLLKQYQDLLYRNPLEIKNSGNSLHRRSRTHKDRQQQQEIKERRF